MVHSQTVIPPSDPRAKTLLGLCLGLCCGVYVLEMVAFLLFQDQLEGPLKRILVARHELFSLGRHRPGFTALVGVLLHAGMAAFMSLALQWTWLRNRKLALSVVFLLFVAFQGALVAVAMGKA